MQRELDSYKWINRGSVYIGNKIVPNSVLQVLIFDLNSKRGKLKRKGKDYHYFNSDLNNTIAEYLIKL